MPLALLGTELSKAGYTELIEREGHGGGVTPAVSLDRSLSGPGKWREGAWALGQDDLEEKVARESWQKTEDACRRAELQVEDVMGGKGAEEVGRG